MKKLLLLLVLPAAIISSCSKDSKDDNPDNGAAVNTWTFTEGSKVFSGQLAFDGASLNTFLQSNNSYSFAMLGFEKNSGFAFNVVLSLLDLNFTTKTYQSGVAGTDYSNAFYYGEINSFEDIYKSSHLDPGPVMTYTITAYDATKDIVTIEFSGQAQLTNGDYVNITKGKAIAKIDRL